MPLLHLKELSADDEKILAVLHHWDEEESQREWYTCRPVTAFDYNPRNQSAEFGYYLPQTHRGEGYGSLLVKAFLNAMFQDDVWQLNKLYATTASGNIPSVTLLERLGFHLDGVIREHYWIAGHVQDQLHYSFLKREYISRLLLD